MRSFAAASSIRSIALSGKKRSVMYRLLNSTAAMIASSLIRTWWWFSYRSFNPRKIDIVLRLSGSSTCTIWKRRSKALSFSKYFWYSSRVVAPIERSSPRASAGFRILAASIAPSPFPAPTKVWISSMNNMILPSDFFTSFTTDFSRSSNSPLYLAPATSAPISSEYTCLFFRFSGTSPRRIRCANPSTIAVLPVPGSPISIGLFFVRRLKIWSTRRISSSRPITGSSLPLRAASFKLMAYFSSDW